MRLRDTAHTGEARDAHSQLSAILDYFNRENKKQLGEIDWDHYKETVHTEGVVDKIRAKYDKFMESEYTVDSAVSKCGHVTPKMQALDVAMQYNYNLYLTHYLWHLEQLETLRNNGDINSMGGLETAKLMRGSDKLYTAEQEIGNFSPESFNEEGVYTRVCTQFSWGTKHTMPFSHSSDAINCVAATTGKLGQ